MGRVRVDVGNLSVTEIDACCPTDDCGANIPPGQGTYRAFRVPRTGELPLAKHTLRITNIARPDSEPSRCMRSGAKFDIAELEGFDGAPA
mmetsp:Transcript_5815/g.16830  ORF Transcript_5815/g.16830 Transcript_5815/m.16830 type:complete len:90 (-) Transcript_5815:5-274(-)